MAEETTSVGDKLTEFRTVYLRAIAQAWIDPKFRAEFLENPSRALQATFQFEWPWDSIVLRVKAHDKFVWTGSDWAWPANEEDSLTLYIPEAVKSPPTSSTHDPILPEEQARALADYYKQRPSLFGTSRDSASSGANKTNTSHQLLQGASWEFSGDSALIGGFMPDARGFLNLEVALVSAMAKAWANTQFRRILFEDTCLALKSVRGYKTPWNMKVRFQPDPAASWNAGTAQTPGASRWRVLTPHALELCLPTAPQDARDQAIGLATYNATGAEYPFTCCA